MSNESYRNSTDQQSIECQFKRWQWFIDAEMLMADCQCKECKLRRDAPGLLKRMNHAFYVVGTANAMEPIMKEAKALIAKVR